MRSLRRPRKESFDAAPDNQGLTMPVPPQPSRLSSEAPEVVPGQFLDISPRSPTPNASVSSPSGPSQPSLSPSGSQLSHFKGRRSPAQSWLSSFSDRGSRKGRRELVPTPQIIYEDAEPYQPKTRTRRVFGLVTTIILVLLAFSLGGGIGGGVATAILKMHHKSTTPAPSTVVVDMAGCPLVANTTYTSSTGASFLVICATSILPQTGQFIDLSHSVQPSFDSCLDACGAADGCVGATWYMFDSTTPARNSGCYLKNGTGQEVVASSTLSVVSGYRTTVLPS